MNRQEFINQLKARIDQEKANYEAIPDDKFLDRANSLGRINGLLQAWEIAQNMEEIGEPMKPPYTLKERFKL